MNKYTRVWISGLSLIVTVMLIVIFVSVALIKVYYNRIDTPEIDKAVIFDTNRVSIPVYDTIKVYDTSYIRLKIPASITENDSN